MQLRRRHHSSSDLRDWYAALNLRPVYFGSARARSISYERGSSRKPIRQAFFMPYDRGTGMKSPRQVQKRCLVLIIRSGKSGNPRSSPYAYDKHIEEQNRLQSFMQHGTASARIDEAEESSHSWAICKKSSSRADHRLEKRASYCILLPWPVDAELDDVRCAKH